MTGNKRLLFYWGYSILSMLLVFGYILNFVDDDVVYFGIPYALAVLFMVAAYRLGERRIWLYPGVNVVLVLLVCLFTAKEERVFLFGHMSWGESFVFGFISFSFIYLLPVFLAALLYVAIAGRRKGSRPLPTDLPQTPAASLAGEIAGTHGIKIAVGYEDGLVVQHFGRSKQFKLYTVEQGAVREAALVDAQGSGHALAGFLRTQGVDTLICCGIGPGAQHALAEAGIRLYGGVSGKADQAVADLLAGTLDYNPTPTGGHDSQDSCGAGAD